MLASLGEASNRPDQPIPQIGLGTFGRAGTSGLELILAGLELGYRHIDTAQTYNTESLVGAAIKRSSIPRAEVFVTTKIAVDNLGDALRSSFERSLDALSMDYVDLTLIHWPSPQDQVPMEDYLLALQELETSGRTRFFGVSNFTKTLLDRAIKIAGPSKLSNNQIEVHPFLQNVSLRSFCHKSGISVTGYVPLAKGRVTDDRTLQRIALRHGRLPSQIALAWAMQQGIIVIPATGSLAHLKSNFAATEIILSPEEMEDISRLDRNERIISPAYSPPWDH
jgi:2,5-diketo-D-gluconate reductase B